MKVYLFMGSHLGEVLICMQHLATAADTNPVQIHVPRGFEWPEREVDSCKVSTYDPESVIWVMDPDSDDTVFILLDPRIPQTIQLENIADDLGKCLIEPVKIITCVDCAAAETSPQLRTWLEACIYYSDVVILGNRGEASKPFVRDYQKEYERKCYPCLFAFLKAGGRLDQPLEVLSPNTRRLTQLFDLEEAPPEIAPGMVIEASCDLELEEMENDPYRTPTEDESTPPTIPDISKWIMPPA
jgi:hypothetical protein